ncbi:hypothetical protein BU24DRAFT_356960 [Aaosphaeria arxii CBS 175.79]|uniref:N-acetyltransferase domain-containing protein n=1 Tax=Aaosphaeria arxii CBS 175.79 TaxID=1450172 RepID=A0A6A5XAJ4_9PLEO|nr:uncharacterized protein BU24DRAFT_356960 [Aaosphaeria arxii CBS 175.79]KAF2009982.1 hypothetical protein BU24DRAFT_356960 [Aaosphaeria arxii CBS 175.79]
MAKILPAVALNFKQPAPTLKPTSRVVKIVQSAVEAVPQTSAFVPPPYEGVRVVTAAEYKEAAACLAEAFAEDDVARYFIDVPDRDHWTAEEKWNLHVEIMEYVTYAHILKGLVTTVDEFKAVALWMPPGQDMDDLWTVLRSGMWRLNYRLSAEGKRRFFNEFLPLLHDTKHATLGEHDETSWYLVYIGTKPSARGHGYCRKLIEHVTRQADRDGHVCYLESSNDVNPAIYRKFGFEDRRTIHLQRGKKNVSLDIMVREPTSSEDKH